MARLSAAIAKFLLTAVAAPAAMFVAQRRERPSPAAFSLRRYRSRDRRRYLDPQEAFGSD